MQGRPTIGQRAPNMEIIDDQPSCHPALGRLGIPCHCLDGLADHGHGRMHAVCRPGDAADAHLLAKPTGRQTHRVCQHPVTTAGCQYPSIAYQKSHQLYRRQAIAGSSSAPTALQPMHQADSTSSTPFCGRSMYSTPMATTTLLSRKMTGCWPLPSASP